MRRSRDSYGFLVFCLAGLLSVTVVLSCTNSDSGFDESDDPLITAVLGEMSWEWDNVELHKLTIEGENLDGKSIWLSGNSHFKLELSGREISASPVSVLGETDRSISEDVSVMVSYGNVFKFKLTHEGKPAPVPPQPLPDGCFAYSGCYEIPSVNLGEFPGFRSGLSDDDRWYYTTTANAEQAVVSHTFSTGSQRNRSYTLLYDRAKRCALWAACAFNSTTFGDKSVGRNEKWVYDPAIVPEDQPNLFKAYVGFSRGHQIASGDRQTTRSENRQTFYFSNMTPQKQPLNGGNWATLESKVQALGQKTSGLDTLYLVTGPVFDEGFGYTQDRSGEPCAVPTRYYKCLMLCTFDASGNVIAAKGAAYLTEGQENSNYKGWLTTINEVESITGFDFFANVPEEIQNAAEECSTLVL